MNTQMFWGALLWVLMMIGLLVIVVPAFADERDRVSVTVGDVTCDTVVDGQDILVVLRNMAGLLPYQGADECAPPGTTFQVTPRCQEDEVIQGLGNFNSTGYWDRYTCVHPDQLVRCDIPSAEMMWDAIWGLYYGSDVLTQEELQHWFAEQSRRALQMDGYVVLCEEN